MFLKGNKGIVQVLNDFVAEKEFDKEYEKHGSI